MFLGTRDATGNAATIRAGSGENMVDFFVSRERAGALGRAIGTSLRPLVVAALLVAPAGTWAAETSLRMSSEPGDYIGAGSNYFYTTSDGTFTVQTNSTSNWASIRFDNSTYTDSWSLQLMATQFERM